MEDNAKPNPAVYLKVLDIFLERLLVKSMIPIAFEDAFEQVKFDMDSMFEDEQNRKSFREIIRDFNENTNLKGWYEGEYRTK